MALLAEIYQTFKEELTPVLLKLSQKNWKGEEFFQIHSIKAILLWYQNKTRTQQKKKITNQYPWWTKIKKFSTNSNDQMQWHIANITHCDHVGLIPGCKGGSRYTIQ
jgi:hypothetical protein